MNAFDEQRIAFVCARLNDRDALTVAAIAEHGPITVAELNADYGIDHFWVGTRVRNEALAEVGLTIRLGPDGYTIAELAHPLPAPAKCGDFDRLLRTVEIALAAQLPAHFFVESVALEISSSGCKASADLRARHDTVRQSIAGTGPTLRAAIEELYKHACELETST